MLSCRIQKFVHPQKWLKVSVAPVKFNICIQRAYVIDQWCFLTRCGFMVHQFSGFVQIGAKLHFVGMNAAQDEHPSKCSAREIGLNDQVVLE